MYQQTITLTYYNGSSTVSTTSGTRYYNPGSGNISNPTFSLTPASLSGWVFRGWATSSAAAAGIAYSSISNKTFGTSTTVYAVYSQTITLSYNENGATSGSTTAQTGTRYWNTGNVSNPSFILPASGFSMTNYVLAKWALNSGSETQYAEGASITIDANATMYAVWVQNVQEFNYTGGMQSYTVPITGIYRFDVYGAQGGSTAADSARTGNGGGGRYGGGNGYYKSGGGSGYIGSVPSFTYGDCTYYSSTASTAKTGNGYTKILFCLVKLS